MPRKSIEKSKNRKYDHKRHFYGTTDQHCPKLSESEGKWAKFEKGIFWPKKVKKWKF